MSEAQRRKWEQSRRRANLIWAISHPQRRRILRRIGDSGASCSPNWLADVLRLSLGTAAYHVTVLYRFGALKVTDEQTARGAVEHFYASTIEDDPPIETLLEETREVDEAEAGK